MLIKHIGPSNSAYCSEQKYHVSKREILDLGLNATYWSTHMVVKYSIFTVTWRNISHLFEIYISDKARSCK